MFKKLHDHFVIVPADKASNNIIFICNVHYIECLLKELNSSDNHWGPTDSVTAVTESLARWRSLIGVYIYPIF